MEETQLELAKLTRTVASTQEYIAKRVEELGYDIKHHKDDCKSQFNVLDKKIHE